MIKEYNTRKKKRRNGCSKELKSVYFCFADVVCWNKLQFGPLISVDCLVYLNSVVAKQFSLYCCFAVRPAGWLRLFVVFIVPSNNSLAKSNGFSVDEFQKRKEKYRNPQSAPWKLFHFWMIYKPLA